MSSTEETNRQMTTSPVTGEVHNVPPQETPSHSLSSRMSSRTSQNYSYSDSFETSSSKEETQDEEEYQARSLKQNKGYSAESDFEDDSYLDTFESESSVLSSDTSFKQPNNSGTDTKSESLAFGSGILDKQTVFDATECSLFQDLPEKPDKISSTSLDITPRFEGEITSAKKKIEHKILQQSKKEEEGKKVFIEKCLQRIQNHPKACEPTSFEYDPKATSKRESKNRSGIKMEKLLGSKFEAPPALLAKIKLKNLMDTMDEASGVRIHDPKKCGTCKTHHQKVEASVARERFLRCKVNDLSRKKVETQIEDHLIETIVPFRPHRSLQCGSDLMRCYKSCVI